MSNVDDDERLVRALREDRALWCVNHGFARIDAIAELVFGLGHCLGEWGDLSHVVDVELVDTEQTDRTSGNRRQFAAYDAVSDTYRVLGRDTLLGLDQVNRQIDPDNHVAGQVAGLVNFNNEQHNMSAIGGIEGRLV